jgi:hypothetical protein
MANIRWSGIESWKYGLTARWYVSAYYGNDVDVDGVGYYNPTTNVNGHGGPKRPFASLSKLNQDVNVIIGANVVIDSGYYSTASITKYITLIGDGTVVIANTAMSTTLNASFRYYNINILSCTLGSVQSVFYFADCFVSYCSISNRVDPINSIIRSIFVECATIGSNYGSVKNSIFISCGGIFGQLSGSTTLFENLIFINCQNLTLSLIYPRPSGIFKDYSIIIGTVKTSELVNGKTTGVTIEDFKINGNYFVKSFSEVDLFGNASGSGATVAQLQTIFNNYFSPIYLDSWQFADLSLKTTVNEKVRFGGLNGTYIGAKPVGYYYSAATLWANRNTTNTSNIEVDAVTGCLQIVSGQEFGTYESNEFDLGKPIQVDPVNFLANLVYNSDGTAKQGVANQRIDTNPDALPDNTENQRVVYDYQLAWSPNAVDDLSAFKNFELNRKPTVDASGDTQLDDTFNVSEQTYITVQRFKVKFVLRKIVIN